ncbi:hypothetical protein GGH94_005510 [Coemansia aciculifera]|uniref:F-box domain-containing protein n=1 Tax=Coemansia aciculifera TaxID=417176 RepID=A0A9W8IJW9_9FUNG|nr:hypothetical protein GGH94_005510 [Coemansia aciculifera]
MLSSSPFQFLPPHVVRLIVNHVVGSSRQVFADIEPNSNEWNTLLKPLLWICHNFRAVAYPLYCSRFKLELSNSQNYHRFLKYANTTPFYIGYRMNNNLGYPTHHLAKTLDVEIDEESIYSGKALKMLSRKPYNGCAFPLVCKIVFAIVTDKDLEGKRAKSNITKFVQRIKQMAPKVDDIWVRPADYNATCYESSPIYGSLVSQLFQLAHRVQYGEAGEPVTSVDLELDGICNLVHIKCTTGDYDESFVKLARQNSTTLESLIIETDRGINVPSIIRRKNDDYVTYPHLHTLKLGGNPVYDDMLFPVLPGAVPFPSLRHLKIYYEYTFGDDVVFRGNAATLESLDLYLSYSTTSVLRQFSVFTPTSHLKLRHVGLWGLDDFMPDLFATITEAMQFAMGIGPTASRRCIDVYANGAELTPTLSQLDGLDSIQVLSLSVKSLELWDVITLIKELPMMSDLTTPSPAIGALPDGVAMDELPKYMVSTYSPTGERFRCWHIGSSSTNVFTVEAECVLLLALACPNFTLVVPPYGRHKEFAVWLEIEIASEMFKPYTPRLKSFID